MNSLSGKIVVITGASSGIGKECAFAFAKENSITVLAARQENKLTDVAENIRKTGKEVMIVKTDVKDEQDCKNLIEKTVEKFGRIDVLINNAGISMRALFANLELKVLKELMDVNFWGSVYCTKYALPFLLQSKGTIVAVSSILGKIPSPGRTGYCASKYAMEGFFDALRLELLKKEVRVLTVRPGFTATEVRANALDAKGTPQGKSPLKEEGMMSPQAVAKKIVKAIKCRRRAVNISTETKALVQLNKFSPSLVDRIVYYAILKEPGSPLKDK
ncbi:MAG: SDR family oxidoreductase [Bacteroidetes bacterium]|nr:SDR family oxidoreductase [Bacteroidota bacterium]